MSNEEDPLKIIKYRYAKGEISKKEYLEMMNDLKERQDNVGKEEQDRIERILTERDAKLKLDKANKRNKILLYLTVILGVVAVIIYLNGFFVQFSTPQYIVPKCAYSNTCVLTPTCPNGTYLNTTTLPLRCNYNTSIIQQIPSQQNCSGDTCKFAAIVGSCDFDSNCTYVNNTNCQCEDKNCYNGYIYDNLTKFCEPPPQCPFRYDYYYNESLGKCILWSACPPSNYGSYHFDPQNQLCYLSPP